MKMMMNGGAGTCCRPCAELAGRLPVPGQKFVQLAALGLTADDALQHIGQSRHPAKAKSALARGGVS